MKIIFIKIGFRIIKYDFIKSQIYKWNHNKIKSY